MGHEQQLEAAMNELGKVKAKYNDAETTVEMFKKPDNPMKGKPFIERLEPGIALQIQPSSVQWFDFYSSLGYRLTSRWTTGIGWMERLATNFKERSFVHDQHAYGPRSYVTFKVTNGFRLRAEAETVNALVMSPYLLNGNVEPGTRTWVWSYFEGVMNTLSISKNVNANVQVIYNIYDPMRRSPYISRLNVRIGFAFPLKKKR
jgi:hypothetical protein